MTKKTILIVEDDQEMHKLYKAQLESEYVLLTAQDTKQARITLKMNKPDMIILDIILPNEGGDTFLSFLKSKEQYKDIPVLGITILNDIEQELHKLDPELIYLPKPFTKKALLSSIKKALKE